ncbi:MAG TPA: hypothetical protein PKC72_12035 [Chitinophagaceae bacterium]|nr:hypothetical protein [Chitinophagaceae bacterium]
MQLEFVKAVQFSLLVKAGGRLREFNFRKLKDPAEQRFSVNVCNERGDRILFSLYKTEDDWEFAENELPKWIAESKSRLRDAVNEEMKKWPRTD